LLVRQLTRQLSTSLNSALSGVAEVITRVLIDLSPTSGAFYSLGSEFVATDEFEAEIDIVTSSTDSFSMIFGGSSSGDYLALRSGGELRLSMNGVVFTQTTGGYNDGVLHTVKISRVGTTVSISADGVTLVTATNTAPFKVDRVGTWANNSFYFKGIESNLRLTDVDTPANNLEFVLNQLTANFEYPVNNVIGSEEVSNNTFDNATGWYSPRVASVISVVGGKLRSTATGTGTFGSAIALTGLTVGELYLFNASATSNNLSASLRFRVATSSNLNSGTIGPTVNSPSSLNETFIATATTMYIGTIVTGHSAGDYVDIDAGISIKSVTNRITYQNIGTANTIRDTYTLSTGGTQLISDLRTIDIAAQA
jgi:hypothetical protein